MSVSVVVPTYNRAGRLPAAIESAFRQGIADLEIIVVDDGSVDETRRVVETYGNRVKYVYQVNAGAGAARNTGIRHATREFVAFLDSDDRWQDDKLRMQLALFEACPDVGLVFSDFTIEKPDGSIQSHGASSWAGRDLDFPDMREVRLDDTGIEAGPRWPAPSVRCWAGPMYRQLLNELPILTSSVVVRRAVLDSTTWFAERVVLFEDWEFFARVARRAHVGYVPAATTVNVGHGDPGRVSKCSAVDRAHSYLTLLQRVWLADPHFAAQHPVALRAAHSRALLAMTREALLAGRQGDARAAAAEWRTLDAGESRAWGFVFAFCAQVAGGRALLRNILRGRTLTRMLISPGKGTDAAVNPAA